MVGVDPLGESQVAPNLEKVEPHVGNLTDQFTVDQVPLRVGVIP